jgi:hypothetical protein
MARVRVSESEKVSSYLISRPRQPQIQFFLPFLYFNFLIFFRREGSSRTKAELTLMIKVNILLFSSHGGQSGRHYHMQNISGSFN